MFCKPMDLLLKTCCYGKFPRPLHLGSLLLGRSTDPLSSVILNLDPQEEFSKRLEPRHADMLLCIHYPQGSTRLFQVLHLESYH